jgi:hypothetical protein
VRVDADEPARRLLRFASSPASIFSVGP